MKPQVKSKEQLKRTYSECLDSIGEFKEYEYHSELDPNKPKIQTPHKVVLSVELRLKRRITSYWKARHNYQTYRPTAWLNSVVIRKNTINDKSM